MYSEKENPQLVLILQIFPNLQLRGEAKFHLSESNFCAVPVCAFSEFWFFVFSGFCFFNFCIFSFLILSGFEFVSLSPKSRHFRQRRSWCNAFSKWARGIFENLGNELHHVRDFIGSPMEQKLE